MRRAYRILPCYTGDVSGVCSALYELGGMVVIHDPSGCNSTYNTHDETRWYDQDSMIFISGLSEMDAILGAALTLFLRDVQKPEVADQLPPLLTVMFSQAASGDAGGNKLRDLLFSEARAFVINGVSSGAFAGRAPSGGSAQGMLAPLFADASTGRKEIRRIGQARPDGHGWLVPFVVHDAGNAESYPVLGRLSPVENGFRLTSVENLEELLGRVRAESLNLSQ